MRNKQNIPVFIVEEHHEAFITWNYAAQQGWIPGKENCLFHVDTHSDMGTPRFNRSIHDVISDVDEVKKFTYKELNIATFDLSNKEFIVLQDKIRHYLFDKYNETSQTSDAKLYFHYPTFGGNTTCGFGVDKNAWVISYNGDVFRCWDVVGQKENAVGTVKGLLEDFGHSIFEKIKLDNQAFERWGCFDCKFFPICGTTCPWDFLPGGEERRCTEWKSGLEYRLLNQYKQFLKDPEMFKNTPFVVNS